MPGDSTIDVGNTLLPTALQTIFNTFPTPFGSEEPPTNIAKVDLTEVDDGQQATATPTDFTLSDSFSYDYRASSATNGPRFSEAAFNFPCMGGGFAISDSSANGRTLQIIGALPWSAAGGPNAAVPSFYSFQSPSDVKPANYAGIDIERGDVGFTFHTRIRTTSIADSTLLVWGDSPPTSGCEIRLEGSGKVFLRFDNVVAATGGVVNDGSWHTLDVVYRAGEITDQSISIFIDGVDTAIVTPAVAPSVGTSVALTLGSRGGASEYFVGDMTDMQFFPKALSVGTITAWANFNMDRYYDFRAPSPSAEGLVMEWMCNDSAATTNVLDTSGRGRDGTLTTSTTSAVSTTGITGKAFQLPTVGPRIEIAEPSINYEIFTVEWWLNPDSLGGFVHTIEALSGWGAFKFHSNGTSGAYVGISVSDRFSPGDMPDDMLIVGQWSKITFSIDADLRMKLYQNGRLLATKLATTPSLPWQGFRVSSAVVNEAFNGKIDGLRIYDRALSDAEVRKSYLNSGAYWKYRMNDDAANTTVANHANRSDALAKNGVSAIRNTDAMSIEGAIRKGLDLDGLDNIVVNSPGRLTRQSMAISIWFKPSTLQTASLATKFKELTGKGFNVFISSDGSITFRLGRGDLFVELVSPPSSYVAGVWQHVVCETDSDSDIASIYLDDSQIATGGGMNVVVQNVNDPLRFGMSSDAFPTTLYNGGLDDIRIYQDTLGFSQSRLFLMASASVKGFNPTNQSAAVVSNIEPISDITARK